jgi:hypothetical protein
MDTFQVMPLLCFWRCLASVISGEALYICCNLSIRNTWLLQCALHFCGVYAPSVGKAALCYHVGCLLEYVYCGYSVDLKFEMQSCGVMSNLHHFWLYRCIDRAVVMS